MGTRENVLNILRPEMGSFQQQLMDEFKEIFLKELSRKPNWRKDEIEDAFDNASTKFIAENILGYKGEPEQSMGSDLFTNGRFEEEESNFGPSMGSFGETYNGPERRGKEVLPPPAGFNRK